MAIQDPSTLGEIATNFAKQWEKEQAELHYLRWFKQTADFGPADSDVHMLLNEQYVRDTGRPIPKGWGEEE